MTLPMKRLLSSFQHCAPARTFSHSCTFPWTVLARVQGPPAYPYALQNRESEQRTIQPQYMNITKRPNHVNWNVNKGAQQVRLGLLAKIA